MNTLILQDWTTIRGSGATSIVQSAQDWLDMSLYQDAVMWLNVTEVTGTVTITYETSPTGDDSLFQACVTGIALATGTTPVVTPVFMLSAQAPIARFLRWRLTGSSSPWDATFRVLVAANPPLD